MEAVEDTTLEAAIGWLSDTILANLPAGGKLVSWISQTGLGNDIGKLKCEVEAVEMVVSAVQGRSAGNKPLTRSLTAVNELLYDADDVVDELDHYRLHQQELQPETLLETDGHGMQQTVEKCRENADDIRQSSSNGRLRSKEWIHFEITEFEQNGGPAKATCKHCEKVVMCTTKMGTSVLRNHLKSKGCSHKRAATDPLSLSTTDHDATRIPTPVATGNSSSTNKMRTGQESTHIAAGNPNGWNKEAFSERIQDITSQLQGKREAITRLLKILGSDSGGASSNHIQSTISDPRRRTSSLVQGKMYGRAQERKYIIELINQHKSTAGVTVLPIIGIGGVGKTALAQLVYNDPALNSQFDHNIWIWVSNNFDEMRLTREMLDCVSQETNDSICSFSKLQEALKGCIKSKRVLLIFDDVWEDMDDGRWNKLLAPFKSGGANGNMIIITTRKLSIAKRIGIKTIIKLGSLRKEDFWLLFKSCTFGDENYEAQASLSDLGQEIAQKLKGNPLAAQTVGALLKDHLTVDHWSNILKTEAWKSLNHTGGIMSALKLSYDELPYHVQQCLSYCSIFPCDYKFLDEELVCHWIAQGFVKRDHSSKSLEEIGRYYPTDLVNLGLFEQVERKRSVLDSQTQTCYVMCGLMHDLARLVARTECATLDGLQCNEILPNVHHLSIVTNSVYRRDDQTGNITRSDKFELLLQNIVASVRKLRTLVLIGEYDSFFFNAFKDVFGKAHNLRLLQMSATSADFDSFLGSLVKPTRFRYLKLQDGRNEYTDVPSHSPASALQPDLVMLAMERPTLEAAIGWLADTVRANHPAGDKLDYWIRQAGHGNDINQLKSEVEEVEMVVSAVQGRAAGNKPLTRSLACLMELLYDADDVVDELDCYRLQQELEPEILLGMDGHGTQQVERSREDADVQSSNGRLRSKEWNHFDITEFEQNGGPIRAKCKYCKTEVMCTTKNGTSVLRNHIKSKSCSQKRGASDPSSSTADATMTPLPVTAGNWSSRKRMRTGEESTHITAANPNSWNKDAFSERIQDITSQLKGRREAIAGLLKILGSDSGGASSSHRQSTISGPRRRTSSLLQGKMYGRAAEKRSIKTLIEKHKSTAGVTFLPIVGIGGVGKTALAQLVYNDPALESQFDHKIWIWASNNFDEMRLTREMLDCVSQEKYDGMCSFPKLQEALKGHIKSKRVLLILDDVWEDMDDGRWNKLLAPFKSCGANGNMIIITTRKPSVSKNRGTAGPINLNGLQNEDFWLLFKASAFCDENYEEQASLSELGQKIAQKLIGNPLAAQTVGALLKNHLTMDHWSNILKTEAWKSLNQTGGIMASLKLSYDELPYHVQLCCSYCSIFPYGYEFHAEELVHLWISQGFVKSDHSSRSLEEMGQYYLTYLVNLGLFEEVKSRTCYSMCSLLYDFARLVSRTKCATLNDIQCSGFLPTLSTVHHLSIVTNSIYQRDDQTGNITRNEKFEFFLQNIVASVRKLRTLVLIGEYDSFFFKAFHDVFEKAHNLRLLQMSATSSDFNSFLCSLANPTHLRYLKIQDGHTEQKALPHVLSKFFHLQVLDVAFFKSLHTVHLEDCGEWRILPSLEMLRFLKRLKLRNRRRVSKVSVPSLEELVLDGMPDLQRCSCTSVGDMESSLRVLEIRSCPALEVFDLFHKGHNYKTEYKSLLPNLRKLIMHNCPHLQVHSPLPPSAIFSELSINEVSTIMTMEGSSMEKIKINGDNLLCDTLDDKILAFHNLKDIKYLEIWDCRSLRFISFKGLSELISLKSLRIFFCEELFSSDDVPFKTLEDMLTLNDVALPALESLDITACGITRKWLSLMLQHSPTLKDLNLDACPQLKQLKELKLTRFKIESLLLLSFDTPSSEYVYDAPSGYADDTRSSSAVDRLVHCPLNLRKITIRDCPHLIFNSLEKLDEDAQENGRCPLPQSLEQLVWSNYSQKALRPCFVGNLTCLGKLEVTIGSMEYLQLDSCTALEELQISECDRLVTLEGMQFLGTLGSLVLTLNSRLKSLQLHSCMALERLEILYCGSLVALVGLQSLVNLKHLEIIDSPALDSLTAVESYEPTKGISSHSYESFPALETLMIDGLSPLNMSFCKGLTRLRSLALSYLDATRLTDEQERALLLLRSLQQLCFDNWEDLVDLAAGLHDLPSLKTLEIIGCYSISELPKEGLPPSLEELVISYCSDALSEGCKLLATSKLEVKIDGDYVH